MSLKPETISNRHRVENIDEKQAQVQIVNPRKMALANKEEMMPQIHTK
jgi:hypothetical protein